MWLVSLAACPSVAFPLYERFFSVGPLEGAIPNPYLLFRFQHQKKLLVSLTPFLKSVLIGTALGMLAGHANHMYPLHTRHGTAIANPRPGSLDLYKFYRFKVS